MLATLTKAKPTTAIQYTEQRIPTLAEVSPLFGELQAKHRALSEEKDRLLSELRGLHERIAFGTPGVDPASQAAKQARAGRVARLLGKTTAEAPPPPSESERSRDRLATIKILVADIEAAVEILDREIAAERSAASLKVCQMIAGAHRDLVAAICAKMLELHELNFRYQCFADQLNSDHVSWSGLDPMFPRDLGDPRSPQGLIPRYLADAIRGGFIPPSAMPEKFR